MDVSLVTGANRGIGKVVALELARAGHQVWAGTRSKDAAAALRAEAEAEGLGERVDVVELDVRSDASVEAAVATVREAAGPVDLLVNNAAIPAPPGVLETQPLEVYRDVMETNFFGPLRLMKEVVGDMRARRSGTIVNISSIGTLTYTALAAPYVAAKCALEGVTMALANQLHPYGVRVAAVLPGFIKTEMLAASPQGALPTDNDPYGRLIRRSIQSFAVNITHAQDPRLVADALLRVHRGEGRLRNPAGAEMDRMFARLGVDRWTETLDPYFAETDEEWSAKISDLFGRNIPPPPAPA